MQILIMLNGVASLTAAVPSGDLTLTSLALLYFGPETVLPIASILAAVAGVFLMLWHYVKRMVKESLLRAHGNGIEEAATEDQVDLDAAADLSIELDRS